jgi:probable phosphoglycerate mutase
MLISQLCIVRHGETDWNKSGILQGWLDVPINAHGRAQAAEMAQTFAGQGFEAVWCSTLVRASETADILSSGLGLAPPLSHEGLKERNFGAIQGIPKSELAELNPTQLEQILRRNPAAQFVGGETMDEFADRVLEALSDIGACHARHKVLVITHGWVLDVITRHIGGLERHIVLPFKPGNGHSLLVEVQAGSIRAPVPAR